MLGRARATRLSSNLVLERAAGARVEDGVVGVDVLGHAQAVHGVEQLEGGGRVARFGVALEEDVEFAGRGWEGFGRARVLLIVVV
jgi:hypothetical protein